MSRDGSRPAFPDGWEHGNTGMTLRQWYAGQALVGLLMSGHRDYEAAAGDKAAANDAFMVADAMLAADSEADR